MKIFQTDLKYLAIMGINAYQSQQKYPFNVRNVLIILLLSTAATSSTIQFFYVANSFNEYTNALYSATGMITATIIVAIVLQKLRLLFCCLDRFESILNKSELLENECRTNIDKRIIQFISGLKHSASREDFQKTNRQVEKWSEFLVTITMTVVYPCVMFSKFIISFFVYFTTDLGDDAFELPFPYWYKSK